MTSISQKCQYALRAIFELAKRYGEGPIRIGEIAEAQAIPPRFLEVILVQLKQGKFVASRRGISGGYFLVRSPANLTIGEIVRFIEGPISPVECVSEKTGEQCPLYGDCAFWDVWESVRKAALDVYDSVTFQGLVDKDRRKREKYVASYSI